MQTHSKHRRACALLAQTSLGALTLAAALSFSSAALAQEQAAQPAPAAEPAPAAAEPDEVEAVVVTGYRAAVQSALNMKRNSSVMVDAINADDIADFPDANLAESLQRLPGVSIDRENGEGRTITVRGLGSDFTRVRLNGLEALSTAGPSNSGDAANRSRGFDFNTFASELFSALKVQKTASAETDEGSLGATVDLETGKPLNFKGKRLALSVQDAYYKNGGTHSPRFAGLVSDRWDTNWGQFGALFSVAYNKRNQIIDSYQRQAGQSDYAYRQATFLGTGSTTATPGRQGFAAPTGTSCNNGVIPGVNITNAAVCSALVGSNPTAYNLVNSPSSATVANGAITAAGPLTRIPALATLNQQDLDQKRTGLTGALQWRPTSRTTISLDWVYSELEQQSVNYQVQTVGLNRNNTNAALNSITAGDTAAAKRALYASCTARAASAIQDAIDCGQSMNGGGLVAGMTNSYNPNNLDPYDYYNNPRSVGYVADPTGTAMLTQFIGRPSVRLIDAALSPTGANADYLKLGNVDLRSAADASFFTTYFRQSSLKLEHEFNDNLSMVAVYGKSSSNNKTQGLLADFIRLDSGQGVAGNDYVTYDARGGGDMPVLNLGFDATQANAWDFVKGYSALRNYQRYTRNDYETMRVDFKYDLDSDTAVRFGVSQRKYGFSTSEYRRLTGETLNPSLKEAGSNVAAVSKVINWGTGLKVPEGTTTAFLAPDLQKMTDLFGFNCNCINKYGDWRLSYLASAANRYSVDEKDTSAYVQFDFNTQLFGRELRGNAGTRYALTEVDSDGLTNSSRPISGSNKYHDILPSLNVSYELYDNLLLRFGAAKVMARPLLANLAPNVTSISVPTNGATVGASLTVGNPKLDPFRATNLDLSLEWYFAPGALVSVAVFNKDISSFPQTLVSSATLGSIMDADAIAALRAAQTNVQAQAYIDNNNPFDVRQFGNAPGGYIRGIEFNYQQNLTFLPWYFKNLGVQFNATHLESELEYIVNPANARLGTPAVTAKGPFTGASPDAFNFTVFYEVEKFSVRLSSAYRAKYRTQYPIATGTCDPGFCDSPLVNDFLGNSSTFNLDGSMTYKFNKYLTLSVDALNLTNQAENRWAYQNDPVVTRYAAVGRSIFAGIRFVY
ncbi:TonB-dependent receptor [Caulobacter sp.]|uniref:TonB-dependent receptor n=1 Tax=Caulobacter sp. TaxID=78 RepID=UPI0025C43797|nr:TonB-dependent receptor [Caulobacter sp.]